VRAQFTGYLMKAGLPEGAFSSKGSCLFRLTRGRFQNVKAALDHAEGQLAQARRCLPMPYGAWQNAARRIALTAPLAKNRHEPAGSDQCGSDDVAAQGHVATAEAADQESARGDRRNASIYSILRGSWPPSMALRGIGAASSGSVGESEQLPGTSVATR